MSFNLSLSVPGSERLPSPNTTSVSPQLWGARNGTLPPIEKAEFLETRPRESAVSFGRLEVLEVEVKCLLCIYYIHRLH